jgi:apolipoprotein N-acyltransferase
MSIFLSILSGALLALAFPKFNFYWIAWVALIPFLAVLYRTDGWKDSLLCGFFFAVTFFGIDFLWFNSLNRFVGWWIVMGWLAFVLFQTLFILFFCFLHNWFCSQKLTQSVAKFGLALFTAFIWALIEWLRSLGPLGAINGVLGYTQVQFLPLIQFAALTTVYGVSFLIVLLNASLAQFLQDRNKWKAPVFTVLLMAGIVIYGNVEMKSAPVESRGFAKLALIQANIDQKDKLDTSKVGAIFEIHKRLSLSAAQQKPDIVIWPETAIFTYLLFDRELLYAVKQLAVDTGAWLIMGTPHYAGGKAYNSVISLSPEGEIVSRYDKQHLVPFGEYLPFRGFLYPVLKGIKYYEAEFNSNPRPQLIEAAGLKLAAAICFESVFPGIIRQRVNKGSDFILLVTNDGWFGDSSAPYFHLNAAVFRAIENRQYFIQVGNTGFSAVIDPYGRVLKKSQLNQQEILIFDLPIKS